VADFLDLMLEKQSRASVKGKPENEQEVKWRIITAENNCATCVYFRGNRNRLPCDFYNDLYVEEDTEGCIKHTVTI
jgi:hypothetical protein